MPVTINFPDKILAGVNQSYTIASGDGPPAGKVLVGGAEVEHRVLPLGPVKTLEKNPPEFRYKVSFFLPDDSAGKELELKFAAGSSRLEETKTIVAG
jgi:hypothetical protein